jgi:hypothetical protein
LLEVIKIGVELEREGRVAEIARLFRSLIIVRPEHPPEVLLNRMG